MSGAEQDPVVNRAIDELRRLPPLDREAVERVVRAAAAARVAPAEPLDPADLPRGRSIRVWSAIGLAAAAAIAGFVIRGARLPERPAQPVAVAPASANTTATLLAGRGATDVMPIMQQFVLDNRRAERVSVVGDFNNWNPKANPMSRTGDGPWSAILPIMPGRHLYGYMVNDSLFILDPRAPKAKDPDLGGEGSVLMVGRP